LSRDITPRTASPPHAAAAGVIFSGQNFCQAQSQNCETKTPNDCPARKTGGDSGEIEMGRKISTEYLLGVFAHGHN
jgi:hypothetical protein